MANPNVTVLTPANFEAEVLRSPLPVLVDFWGKRCPPCIHLAPIIDEIADERAGRAKIAKLDVEVEGNLELAGQYHVKSLPTLIFFKDGQPIGQLVGRKSKAEVLGKLDGLA
jgi:thioredoxin 1